MKVKINQKSIFALCCLMFLSFYVDDANASQCSSRLTDANGRTLRVFYGEGRDVYQSCSEAEMLCQDELRWRSSRGAYGLRCITDRTGGGYDPYPPRRGNVLCEASLYVNYRGYINTFRAYGYDRRDACRDALRDCNLSLRRSYGNNVGRCDITYTSDDPTRGPTPPRRVTEICRVGLYNRTYGNLIRQFSATYSGHNRSQARQAACSQAMRQCTTSQSYNQLCRKM